MRCGACHEECFDGGGSTEQISPRRHGVEDAGVGASGAPSLQCPPMSFSFLVHEQCKKIPARIEAWEKAVVELQVVLAYADGVLSPIERMAISLLCIGDTDQSNLVTPLSQTIEKTGLESVAERVLCDVRTLLEGENVEARHVIASDLVRQGLSLVASDGVLSDKELTFICDRLGPGIGLPSQQIDDLVIECCDRLERDRMYAERAFEMYLMLAALDDEPPFLVRADGVDLPGFVGAVDAFVVKHRLGSSRVLAYYLGAMEGVFWVDHHEQHLASLEKLVTAARERTARVGVDSRLKAIHIELGQIRHGGIDPTAYKSVARHVLHTLERMDGLNEAQRKLLENGIGPSVDMDPEALRPYTSERRESQRRASSANEVGEGRGSSPSGAEHEKGGSETKAHARPDEERSVWRWRFWK